MCHSVLFGFLIGALVTRMFIRYRFFRHYYGRGGGCGHGRCHQNGGDQRRWRAGFQPAPTRTYPAIDEVVAGLELNQRQQDEARGVLSLIKEQLGDRSAQAHAVLAAVAAEPFDRLEAEAALSAVPPALRRELVDGLEHVHTILIPEQRAALRERLEAGAPKDKAAGTPL